MITICVSHNRNTKSGHSQWKLPSDKNCLSPALFPSATSFGAFSKPSRRRVPEPLHCSGRSFRVMSCQVSYFLTGERHYVGLCGFSLLVAFHTGKHKNTLLMLLTAELNVLCYCLVSERSTWKHLQEPAGEVLLRRESTRTAANMTVFESFASEPTSNNEICRSSQGSRRAKNEQ